MSPSPLALLPPHRLGVLLASARTQRDISLEDVGARSALGAEELAAVEAGDRRLTESEIDVVLAAYGIDPDDLVPSRSRVILDLDSGELLVADETIRLHSQAPTPDEVLAAYLSVVYTLRQTTPGSAIVLRDFDVSVLSRVLELSEPDVEARLAGLMVGPSDDVSLLTRLLKSKIVLPLVGAVAVATALGTVLVIRADDPVTTPTNPPSTASTLPPAELLPPSVQSINPDGTPGPVEVPSS